VAAHRFEVRFAYRLTARMFQAGCPMVGLSCVLIARVDDPIVLPDGRQLVTLKDAGTYITKLPKAEHEAPDWQAAMEALILVRRLEARPCLRGLACCAH
jgi:hypothetical protein